MNLKNKIAEAIAKRIKPETVVERLGVSVGEEISKQVKSISSQEIEERIKTYLSSDEFKTDYQDLMRDIVEELLPQYAPVLVLEQETFKQYKENHKLEGPIATVNTFVEKTWKNEGYSLALSKIKKQAREMGGDIVELLEKEFDRGIFSDRWFLGGNLYINRYLFSENQKTNPNP